MYTLESLQSKTFKELKDIGRDLNVLPDGDKRCRQNWIDALTGVQPPLLQLLETSPVVEVETVQEPPLESKFDRIAYPRPTNIEPKMSQSAIGLAAKNSLDAGGDLLTVADSWNPAEFGEVLHAVEPTGQMNLLQWDTSEPPEPDDFDSVFAFWNAYDRWLLSSELHEIIHKNDPPTIARTDTRCDGASENFRDNSPSPECNICSQHDGASLPIQNHSLGSQEGDRILEISRHNSRDSGRVISHQPAQLVVPQTPIVTPQAYENEQQPPGRGDGRGDLELAIGMLVGGRRDRQHLGKILDTALCLTIRYNSRGGKKKKNETLLPRYASKDH